MVLTVISFLFCFVSFSYVWRAVTRRLWGGEIVHLLGVGQTTYTKQAQHYMGFSKKKKKKVTHVFVSETCTPKTFLAHTRLTIKLNKWQHDNNNYY